MKSNTNLILFYQIFEDMAIDKNTIGNKIKKPCKNLNLTQDDLSRKSGVKYATLSIIEIAIATKSSIKTTANILKALYVYIADLLK